MVAGAGARGRGAGPRGASRRVMGLSGVMGGAAALLAGAIFPPRPAWAEEAPAPAPAPAPVPVAEPSPTAVAGAAEPAPPPVEPAPPPPPRTTLCDVGCAKGLEGLEMKELEKGVKYQEVKAGAGEPAPVGYQVLINYVMRVPGGQEFANTVTGDGPQDVRVGTGNLIEGMDLGLKGMRTGEIRRLYIPGDLGFEKGLPAAPGRARVLPKSDIVVDLELLYVPGLDY